MAVNKMVIDGVFEEIWEMWPNKDGEASAKKAINVYFNSGGTKKDILDACKAYCIESLTSDAEFTYKLSNFINQDHWKDILENTNVKRLIDKQSLAKSVIEEWNNACHSHWCKVSDVDYRLAIVMRALDNKAFKENWKESLKLASGIFKHKLDDGDPRSKIILSLSWFANVSPNKHTVLKIKDGEYGKPRKDISKKISKLIVKSPTVEEREEVVKNFNEIFGTRIKPIQIERKIKPDDSTKEITRKALQSIGIKNEGDGSEDDPYELI